MPAGQSAEQPTTIQTAKKKQTVNTTAVKATVNKTDDDEDDDENNEDDEYLPDAEPIAERTTDTINESSVKIVFDKLKDIRISEEDSYFDNIAERLGFADRIFITEGREFYDGVVPERERRIRAGRVADDKTDFGKNSMDRMAKRRKLSISVSEVSTLRLDEEVLDEGDESMDEADGDKNDDQRDSRSADDRVSK